MQRASHRNNFLYRDNRPSNLKLTAIQEDAMELSNSLNLIKTLVFCSVVFVWVVRYSNIVEEFKQFGYPAWLRDLVGIAKLTLVTLMMTGGAEGVRIGAAGISLLMLAALGTHVRIGNSFPKMLPSLTLLALNLLLFFNH